MTDNKKSETDRGEQKVTLSVNELLQVIRESNDNLAKAIENSRVPYVSPEQKRNEAAFRQNDQLNREKQERNLQISRDNCPHMQGSNSLSDFAGQLTSIVWHRLDDGITPFGLCTNCGRQFWPDDPDYRLWMNKKSGNRISSSGQRFGVVRMTNPAKQSTPYNTVQDLDKEPVKA